MKRVPVTEIRVVLCHGEDALRRLLDIRRRDVATETLLRDALELYEFSNEAEAEAFRRGLCAVRGGEDIFELGAAESVLAVNELRLVDAGVKSGRKNLRERRAI